MEETTDLRRSRSGYEFLAIETPTRTFESKPKLGTSLTMKLFGRTEKMKDTIPAEVTISSVSNTYQATKETNIKKISKISHPIFNLQDARGRKKAMKNPEFIRYMEYVKERGEWDAESNSPAIYFK
ncbi:hypothetical protein FRX31_029210 [Thalictrum thalictroides]|uniref:Uncharacterized protein n=1 Tax=Thalictrum thalictroides TaxID=46969 RepID=A0A7J6V9Z8_THATH|nr:hypothetical protein FRX31_029210 [Thalictrum thalictroides]